jgi:hypothetical protein
MSINMLTMAMAGIAEPKNKQKLATTACMILIA